MNQLFAKFLEKLKNIHELNRFERNRLNSRLFIITGYLGLGALLIFFLPVAIGLRSLIYSEWFLILKIFSVFIFLYWVLVPFIASKLETNKEHLILVLFIITFFISIYYLASYKLWAARNKSPHTYPTTVITLKDSTQMTTGDTLLFVGKTNNYLFLYRDQSVIDSSHVKVIPMEDVSRLKIYKHLNWLKIP